VQYVVLMNIASMSVKRQVIDDVIYVILSSFPGKCCLVIEAECCVLTSIYIFLFLELSVGHRVSLPCWTIQDYFEFLLIHWSNDYIVPNIVKLHMIWCCGTRNLKKRWHCILASADIEATEFGVAKNRKDYCSMHIWRVCFCDPIPTRIA